MPCSLSTTFMLVILIILEKCSMLKEGLKNERSYWKNEEKPWKFFQCASGVCARDCTLL
jgi:hypothetical protein